MSAGGVPAGRSVIGSPLLRSDVSLAGKIRWHLNARLSRRLPLLNATGARLTIVDAYGAPGDTLLTATICRNVHARWPRLRINCVTPNPELLEHDPAIQSLNRPETFFSVWSWYPDLVGRRDGTTHLLRETFDRLSWGGQPYDQRCRVHLTAEEKRRGRERLGATTRPILTFSTQSKEVVKNWPVESWRAALAVLRGRFHLVQLGDASEPEFEGVQRFAGRLSLRESMGVLANAQGYVGGVSFLMHAASGLDVPAVIIYGGRETPANSGYTGNVNLYSAVPCSPCWIHTSRGERCEHGLRCMHEITVAAVVVAVEQVDFSHAQ